MRHVVVGDADGPREPAREGHLHALPLSCVGLGRVDGGGRALQLARSVQQHEVDVRHSELRQVLLEHVHRPLRIQRAVELAGTVQRSHAGRNLGRQEDLVARRASGFERGCDGRLVVVVVGSVYAHAASRKPGSDSDARVRAAARAERHGRHVDSGRDLLGPGHGREQEHGERMHDARKTPAGERRWARATAARAE